MLLYYTIFLFGKFYLFCLCFHSLSEHEVDIDSLSLITEEDISKMIPKIGLRAKFLNKWRNEVSHH